MNEDMTLGRNRAGAQVRKDRKLFEGAVIREGLRRTMTLSVIMGIIMWTGAVLVPFMREAGPNGPILYGPLQINPLLALSFMVCAPFLTLNAFDFLNSRAGSDLFHSWPVKRRSIAAGFLTAVSLWLALLIAGSMLISVAVCGLRSSAILLDRSRFGLCFLQLLAASVLVEMSVFLAMTVTGTLLSNIVTALGLIFLPRFLILMAAEMLTDRIPMLSIDHLPLFFSGRLNIVTGFVFEYLLQGMFSRGNGGVLYYLPSVLYTFLLAALYGLAGVMLFVRRPSETAGKPALGSGLQCAIRIGIGFLISVPAASAIGSVNGGMAATDLAVLLAIFLAAFAAMFVYEYLSARRLLSVKQLAGGILTILLLDAFWISAGSLAAKFYSGERIDAEQIESVTFCEDDSYPAGVVFDGGEGYYQSYWGSLLRQVPVTDEKILQMAARRHEQTVLYNGIREEIKIPDDSGTEAKADSGKEEAAYLSEPECWRMDCRIRFRNGKEIYRRIFFTREDIRAVWEAALSRISGEMLKLPDWTELQNIYTGYPYGADLYGWEMHDVYEVYGKELSEKTPQEWFRILTDESSYRGDPIHITVIRDGRWLNGLLPLTKDFPETRRLLENKNIRSEDSAETEKEAQTEGEQETGAGPEVCGSR